MHHIDRVPLATQSSNTASVVSELNYAAGEHGILSSGIPTCHGETGLERQGREVKSRGGARYRYLQKQAKDNSQQVGGGEGGCRTNERLCYSRFIPPPQSNQKLLGDNRRSSNEVHHGKNRAEPLIGALRISITHYLKHLDGEFLGLFPCEVGIFTAEVTVSCSLLEDGPTKLKITHEAPGAKVEVVVDDLNDLFVCLPGASLSCAC